MAAVLPEVKQTGPKWKKEKKKTNTRSKYPYINLAI
jgi:hypothetical protein